MRYELSGEQYSRLWGEYNVSPTVEYYPIRLSKWNQYVKSKYKLRYYENNDISDDDDTPYGWYGIIFGNEKHINFFILQL